MTTTNEVLFPKATNLEFEFCEDWPMISLQSLCIFIDIARIVRITISGIPPKTSTEDLSTDIASFLERADHLSSLIIDFPMSNQFYSNLPRSIEHLEISIDDLNQIPVILQRCSNLSTIKFCHLEYSLIKKILNWFTIHTIDSTSYQTYRKVFVWLGKINI